MFWLRAVTARLQRFLLRLVSRTASPTPHAGLVSLEPMTQPGNSSSAVDTDLPAVSPVKKPVKKRASPTKAVAKRTPAKAPARTNTDNRSGGRGR